MPLSEYEIVYETIPLPRNGKFAVRGMALPDLTHLVQNHLGDLTKAVELYAQRKQMAKWSKTSLAEFATILARDLPLLTTEIISVCADEPDQQEKVAKLPFLVQLNALLVVCKLTMEEAGGLKNLSAFAPLLAGVADAQGAEPGTLKRRLLDFIMGYGGTGLSSPPMGT